MTREEVLQSSLDYFNGDSLAASVWVDKYCLRNKEGDYLEKTPEDMHWRLASELFRIENRHPNPMQLREIFDLLKGFRYFILGGSPMAGIGNDFQVTTLSNCYVIGGHNSYDSYGSIMRTDEEQVHLMKRRGGVGHDLSHLRPHGTKTSNSSNYSTGATTFMERYSATTREVAQGGRRGALMLSIAIEHPDAERFIDAKLQDGKVSGANISVKVSNEFMGAVERDDFFVQRFPIGFHLDDQSWDSIVNSDMYREGELVEVIKGCYIKKVKAKRLWGKIIHNAWKSAEPGILFWDKILIESPAGSYGAEWKESSCNPCGELPLPDGDSCRLGCMNLFSYVKDPFTPKAYFDFDLFYYHSILSQRLMDNLVDLEIEKLDTIIKKIQNDPEPYEFRLVELNLWLRIKEKAIRGRRTGLGITGEGDMLAALGLRYGSQEGVEFSVKVHKMLAKASYESSITMARERGHFPDWNLEKEGKNPFINRVLDAFTFDENWSPEKGQENPIVWEYEKYGRRNIANLTIAPTGSVSIMTQTSSGIEPCFQPFYTRRRKVDSGDSVVFTDKSGDNWEEYRVFHHNFVKWFDMNWYKLDPNWFDTDFHPEIENLSKEKLEEVYRKSPYFEATSNDVDFIEKVKMQGRVQEWVDHSISVTINCPKETTVKQVEDMYLQAWKSGCKGVTVYRDGCREGVLIKDKSSQKFSYSDGEERPEVLPCKVHHLTALKEEWVVIVGLKDGNPFEIFAIKNNIPETVKEGEIVRRKSKVYSFVSPKFVLENITDFMRDDDRTDTRKYSLMLRHRVHPRHIVDQIEKYASISSFDKAISRVLKKYFEHIPKGVICDKCGAEMKNYEEGCLRCDKCGNSMCG